MGCCTELFSFSMKWNANFFLRFLREKKNFTTNKVNANKERMQSHRTIEWTSQYRTKITELKRPPLFYIHSNCQKEITWTPTELLNLTVTTDITTKHLYSEDESVNQFPIQVLDGISQWPSRPVVLASPECIVMSNNTDYTKWYHKDIFFYNSHHYESSK